MLHACSHAQAIPPARRKASAGCSASGVSGEHTATAAARCAQGRQAMPQRCRQRACHRCRPLKRGEHSAACECPKGTRGNARMLSVKCATPLGAWKERQAAAVHHANKSHRSIAQHRQREVSTERSAAADAWPLTAARQESGQAPARGARRSAPRSTPGSARGRCSPGLEDDLVQARLVDRQFVGVPSVNTRLRDVDDHDLRSGSAAARRAARRIRHPGPPPKVRGTFWPRGTRPRGTPRATLRGQRATHAAHLDVGAARRGAAAKNADTRASGASDRLQLLPGRPQTDGRSRTT